MEPGITIQLIWPLAAEEAFESAFECIEPAHLLSAALKFVELEDRQFKMMTQDNAIVRLLVRERDVAREKLAARAITVPDDSRTMRHAMRAKIGQGGYNRQKEQSILRSSAAMEICNAAEEAARTMGERYWGAAHLLTALLDTPTENIAAVMAEWGGSAAASKAETPLLDARARDVTAEACERKLQRDDDCMADPAFKVLLDMVLSPENNKVLLIQATGRAPEALVEQAAVLFVGDNPPKGSRGKRIIEISLNRLAKETATNEDIEERLDGMLRETNEAGNVILWFSAFHRLLILGQPKLVEILEKHIAYADAPAIASTSDASFIEHIKDNKAWKKGFHAVWLHDVPSSVQL